MCTAATWCASEWIDEQIEKERRRKRGKREKERERAGDQTASRIKAGGTRITGAPSEYQWRTRRNRVFEKNGFKVECGGTRRVSLSTGTSPSRRGESRFRRERRWRAGWLNVKKYSTPPGFMPLLEALVFFLSFHFFF